LAFGILTFQDYSSQYIVLILGDWFLQFWVKPHGWSVSFPHYTTITQITVSSVKLRLLWLLLCCVEWDCSSVICISCLRHCTALHPLELMMMMVMVRRRSMSVCLLKVNSILS